MLKIIKNKILKLQEFLLDALFPWHCLYCLKENENILCENCLKMIPIFSDFQCLNCQKLITSFNHQCHNKKSYLFALGAVSFYENPILKKAIHTFKYQKIIKTKEVLNNLMIAFLERSNFFKELMNKRGNILVLAVPLNKKRERKRGFNQAEILAENIANHFQLNYQKKILIRKYNNPPQVILKNPQEREKNVKGIFKIQPQKRKILKNKIIILIDDVYTTGATMNEIGKILKKAKVKKIIGLVLAK
ncbi:MAG: ComF family protein [Minisyncoccia bacterium]